MDQRWMAHVRNCNKNQELQETLQGERSKLLDAHEKMKLFQQEVLLSANKMRPLV